MPADPRRRRPTLLIGAAAGVAALLTGCGTSAAQLPESTQEPSAPTNSPTITPAARPFTVTTTQAPRSLDPALALTEADSVAALNLFQRLLVFHAATGELKPDAGDCLYRQPTVYECTVAKGLTFSNGHALGASDVKFSIERALRLESGDTSMRMFDSLDRMELVDALTLRFDLKWPDTQFGEALASPAASIVDEEAYDPDRARPNSISPMGSGPFVLQTIDAAGMTFLRNEDYLGSNAAALPLVRLNVAADSAAAEDQMAAGATDVVWRSLDAAALGRLADGVTKTNLTRADPPASRANRVVWNSASPYRLRADVRAAVAQAMQADRTVDSVVPPGVVGSAAAFPVGGRLHATAVSAPQPTLTLAYSSDAPGEGDLARLVADRLGTAAGLRVQVRADAAGADLQLTDEAAWVNTALGWLQEYLDHPLPGSQAKLAELGQTARTMPDGGARLAVLAELQQQAAADATVVPISSGSSTLYLRNGVKVVGDAYGPCWQLGLWGFTA